MQDLIIIGASGFGKEVAWLVDRIKQRGADACWNILGFLDDNKILHNSTISGYPVLGGCESINKYADAYYVCAIGSARIRASIIRKIETLLPNVKYATLIDPSVILSDSVMIGPGSIICAGTILTIDIQIGSHVIINLDCTVGHDSLINDFATLYPSVNISGIVKVERCVELGTGAQIIQGRTVGEGSIVGAGAVVVKDLPPKCTAVGSPAKAIKFHE